MSIGPMGIVGSAAGSSLAQGQGAEVPRAQQAAAENARQTQMNEKAEQASGVGQTEQDEGASDRDADGRRPWEVDPSKTDDPSTEAATSPDDPLSHAKDPTGQCGNQLDLSG